MGGDSGAPIVRANTATSKSLGPDRGRTRHGCRQRHAAGIRGIGGGRCAIATAGKPVVITAKSTTSETPSARFALGSMAFVIVALFHRGPPPPTYSFGGA